MQFWVDKAFPRLSETFSLSVKSLTGVYTVISTVTHKTSCSIELPLNRDTLPILVAHHLKCLSHALPLPQREREKKDDESLLLFLLEPASVRLSVLCLGNHSSHKPPSMSWCFSSCCCLINKRLMFVTYSCTWDYAYVIRVCMSVCVRDDRESTLFCIRLTIHLQWLQFSDLWHRPLCQCYHHVADSSHLMKLLKTFWSIRFH